MNEKLINTKNPKDTQSPINKHEEFTIPFEAACSPEFIDGCFIMEDEADKEFEEK